MSPPDSPRLLDSFTTPKEVLEEFAQLADEDDVDPFSETTSKRQLAARGIDPQAYAKMQGKDRHELIDDAEQDAERALRREATLEAVADAEGIEAGCGRTMPAGCWGEKEVAEVGQLGDGTAAGLVVKSSKRNIRQQAGEGECIDTTTC